MNGLKKRTNPFDTPKTIENETPAYETEVTTQQYVEETPVTMPRKAQVVQKNYVPEPKKEGRDKFTSTMETRLRRKIKVYCAENGILFAEFVEVACKEKLRREGVDR